MRTKMKTARTLPILFTLFLLACSAKHTAVDKPHVVIEPPTAPYPLRGEAITANSIRLTWVDNSNNEEYFAVYRRESETGPYQICQRLFFNTTTCIDSGLVDSSTYSYYVVAELGDTSSSHSNSVTVTTLMPGLTLLGSSHFQCSGATVDIYRNYAFAATRDAQMRSINVSGMEEISTWQAPGEIRSISIRDSVAYLAMGIRGLMSLVISDPYRPAPLGGCDTPGYSSSICFVTADQGFYIYAVDGQSIQIIDPSVPAHPVIAAEFQDPEVPFIYDSVTDQRFLYLAVGNAGLRIYNILDHLAPSFVSSLPIPGGVRDLTINVGQLFSHAYILNATSDLYIANITDRNNPTIVSSYPVGSAPRRVCVEGNLAYVPCFDGLKILDISDPSAPRFAAFYPEGYEITGLRVWAGIIYMATTDGLKILQYTP